MSSGAVPYIIAATFVFAISAGPETRHANATAWYGYEGYHPFVEETGACC